MPDPVVVPVTPIPEPGAGAPWFQGLEGVDSELIGHLQNKGWHDKPAQTVALAAIKAHREAERSLGMRTDHDIVMVPKDATKGDMNPVWERLGRPKLATEYDFTGVKFKDGTELDTPFLDFMRERAFKANLPKAAATEMARGLVEFMEGQDTREAAETSAALSTERTSLARNWGTTPDKLAQSPNMLVAQNAVRALGLDRDTVTSLEQVVGYSKVMEMFRNIGTKIGEDTFITGNGIGAGNNGVMTRDQAVAKKAELSRDTGWVTKFLANDQDARRTMAALDQIIVAGMS